MYSLILEDLGKRYTIGKQKSGPRPRRRLNLGFASIPLPLAAPDDSRELWALRNVSFSVPPGTIFGLVGPNGAGKSTLLKIIARVTRPTEGRVIGRGRVVSLLELGAGFNPDFSARDNILMNAAMHGLSRSEVLGRLDDIVAFAEVEKFLDSPLKHFSSGMYLRLAFSVAINMQPDILLADEILAVGDIAFQERCLERVAEEAKKGLTVLFVSHDMAAISRLCEQVVWLDAGQLRKVGEAGAVVAEYQEAALGSTRFARGEIEKGGHANLHVEIANVRLMNAMGQVVGAANIAEESFVRMRLRVRKGGVRLRGMVDAHVKGVFAFRTIQPEPVTSEDKGIFDLSIRLPANFLSETTYHLTVTVNSVQEEKELKAVRRNALSFLAYGSEDAGLYKNALLAPRLDWSVKKYLHVLGSTEYKRRKAAARER
jgi:ABC-type polysaccharide/polyol phosphate transport system ATPase subunit